MKTHPSLRAKRQHAPLKDTGDRLEHKRAMPQSRHLSTGSRQEGPSQAGGNPASRYDH